MKVYVEPPASMSRAMFRVARALRRYAPKHVQVVDSPHDADVQVMHVIGPDALTFESAAPRVAVIQYCMNGDKTGAEWQTFWGRATAVWSYYDLSSIMPTHANFYYAPLGIDSAFRADFDAKVERKIGVVTSGYVNGPGAEAIEEMVFAAHENGLFAVHIGPVPVNLTREMPSTWRNLFNISDTQLANIYQHAQWVSGLRHVEGFEMPVIEGLACGARPIVFDRADMRSWYDDYAVFVKEDETLSAQLSNVFATAPKEVTATERERVLRQFDWSTIVTGFWDKIQ
jgi:hypothetical protein